MDRLRVPRHVSWLLAVAVALQGANYIRHLMQDANKDLYKKPP